ncbi:DUF262 domain-containing protein [Microbacterium sp. LWH11-1.2]|uniref:DUF262 domain-containing protein n=1 Tax=Microbacterium sp. LWH11-1.2 TaxID=3135258 RepID=UPI0031387A95
MAGTGLEIEANLRGIGHVLRDMTLSVPPFQRNYSWTEEQVSDYWYDLRAAISAAQPYYFMGTVVVSRDGGPGAIVIDGQQRLATTSLLLAAIRDRLSDGNEANRARTLQSRYLTGWSLENNVDEPRLDLNEADRPYFRSAVLHQLGNAATPHRPLLSAAFDRLRGFVAAESEAAGPHWVERLLQWVEYLDRRAQVILMETANDGDAFMVFETLNDRGLPLAVADVIKNYLLSLSRSRLEDASALWLAAVDAIEASGPRDSLTDFIRHWWNARSGATRERDLYAFIRSAIRSGDQSMSALKDLAREAPMYASLTDVGHLLWEEQQGPARSAASVLIDLGLEQYRPLALAVLSQLPPSAVTQILLAAVGWSVRALIVGGSGGGTAERLYAEAAVRVMNGRSDNAEAVFSDVSTLIARDKEFEAAFAARRIHRSATLRYLLRALCAEQALPDGSDGLVPVPMFPRTDPNQLWTRIASADQLADVTGRLGNFVLINREDVGDAPLEPLARYAYLTARAEQAGGVLVPWNELALDEVGRRQSVMAERAVRIWPLLPDPQEGA